MTRSVWIPVLFLCAAAGAAAQTISTIAGTDWAFPATPLPALQAPLAFVNCVAVDPAGNYYVSDASNVIFKVNASGTLSRLAGNGAFGSWGDGGPATNAALGYPQGIAADGSGNVFIADSNNNVVRMVNAAGIISRVAGNGSQGFSGDGGPATSASLSCPEGVALDGSGNLFISDACNYRIRMVSHTGTITTVAGNGVSGYSGDGGPATSAMLATPWGLTVDKNGNLLIADANNFRIRMVNTAGIITTVAGNGVEGYSGDNGPATTASISASSVATDSAGSLFIADLSNRVRQVNSAGIITTIAGNGSHDYSGDGGPATSAALARPSAVAVDSSGNVLIGDGDNKRIRKMASNGIIATVAGNGCYHYGGDGDQATSAALNLPIGLAADNAGNVYIADSQNMRIREVSPSGAISTIAGNGIYSYSGDGGLATGASLANPQGVSVDRAGNLLLADSSNSRIRMVSKDGTIATVAGRATWGYGGDGGPAVNAALASPVAIASDSAGNLFIADTDNEVVRMVNPTGIITTVAGNHVYGYSGDGGLATRASLSFPTGVAVDKKGDLLIADSYNARVRMVDAAGIITTVAGGGLQGSSGDGGPATGASFYATNGIALDGAGNLFIVDQGNDNIRMVNTAGIIFTIAGGIFGFSGDGGPAVHAGMNNPLGVAVDSAGNVLIADTYNYRIRKVTPCVLAVNPASVFLDSTSQTVPPLSVAAAGPICPWSASANDAFITVTSGATGKGTGTFAFSVPANSTGAALTGTVYVNSKAVSVTQRETAAIFTDTLPSNGFFDFIDTMSTRGITAGCGTNPPRYCPDATTTRGEMAVFLITAIEGANSFTYTATPYFTDVQSNHPFFKFIQKLRALGITGGCTATTYCPDDSVTRGEMAVFIIASRYGTTPYTYPATPYFTDVPAGSWYFPFVQKMARAGITAGCAPGLYCPDATLTRGQMAVFIVTGLLNQLLPATAPVITSAAPNAASTGQNVTLTLSAVNTHFAQGATQVSMAAGLTPSGIVVNSDTSLTVQVAVSSGSALGPTSIVVTTGAEEAVLPNGFTVQ